MRDKPGFLLTVLPAAALLVAALAPLPAEAGSKPTRVGKNPGNTKGRWLEVDDPQELQQYKRVAIGDVTTDVQWKREANESPIDEQLLSDKIREHLLMNIRESGLFEEVLEKVPQDEPEGSTPIVRLDCDLLVEPGSRAARYFVGMGAGKSKSILEIHLRDHATDRDLGLYHGYGVGTGMGFKVAGGGARKMTQDDIQENAKEFAKLLKKVL